MFDYLFKRLYTKDLYPRDKRTFLGVFFGHKHRQLAVFFSVRDKWEHAFHRPELAVQAELADKKIRLGVKSDIFRREQIRQRDCGRRADADKVLPRDRTAYLNHCLEAMAAKQ